MRAFLYCEAEMQDKDGVALTTRGAGYLSWADSDKFEGIVKMQTVKDGTAAYMAIFFDNREPIDRITPNLNVKELHKGDWIEVRHIVGFAEPLR